MGFVVRESRSRRAGGLLVALLLFGVLPGAAHAKSHLWRFTEFFSDASGDVQFVEMFVFDPAGTAEISLNGFTLTSDANVYVFPNNLPNENTFQRWLLIATQSFADLPGAPTPDYIIPEGFFDPDGDELHYRNTVDVFAFTSGQLPTDGVQSLAPNLSTAVNSPTNFAGDAGSVDASPAPAAPVPALPFAGILAVPAATLAAWWIAARRRREA